MTTTSKVVFAASASGPRRLLRALLNDDQRLRLRLLATALVLPRERVRAHRFGQKSTSLRLHVGSGKSPKAGWVNIDVLGHPVDLAWNIQRGLPFRTETIRAVFHEHVLEHFTKTDGLRLLRECHRVLEPGGILRVGVPDLHAFIQSYVAQGTGLLADTFPRETPTAAFNKLVYEHGHKAMYDADSLCDLFHVAGFSSARRVPFAVSQLGELCPDSPVRERGTLYVEAAK
jgi:predicted SAM-dependent methyltransferase